jgi:hypothetical protein
MQLLLEVKNKGATKRLEKLEKGLAGSTDLMTEIAALIAERNGKGWSRVKLQPSTLEWKQQYGESEEPLVETGKMREELTTEKGIKLLTPTELIFGSDSKVERGRPIPVSKARLLQRGTKHQKKHKVLKVTPTTRTEITELVKHHLLDD